ncbi:hypothetical protein TSUD_65770 [Trifolium subterraneum]|uniref:Uncharacterized protein n=1 Tax=Trifolium subterraneum TaxID=3900 RepID=A0A2Z6NL70_TRISU|nr:hypothetical protein TSUD_65770 [Trifolium subterraneum]
MGLHHRKLLSVSDCIAICHEEQSCATDCDDDCFRACYSYNLPPPPPPSHDHKNKTSTYLIISFSIVAALFLVLCCYAFYVKFFSHRNRSRRTTLLTRQQTELGFVVDEEHDDGSVVDHPICDGNGMEDSVVIQLRNGEEEEEANEEVEEDEGSGLEMVNMQQPRRSVSLDSSSAAKINLALSNFPSVEESQGNSNSNREHVGEVNEQVGSKRVGENGNMVNMHSAPCSMKKSRSFNGKHLLSLHSSSQKKINPPVRSF